MNTITTKNNETRTFAERWEEIRNAYLRRADPDYAYVFSSYVWRVLLAMVSIGIVCIAGYAYWYFSNAWSAVSADARLSNGSNTSQDIRAYVSDSQAILNTFANRRQAAAQVESRSYIDPSQ